MGVSASFEEKEMRVFTIALTLALTLTLFLYPEGDLNPHSRYGQRILSPSCLPFHHPGADCAKLLYLLLRMVEWPSLQSGCSLPDILCRDLTLAPTIRAFDFAKISLFCSGWCNCVHFTSIGSPNPTFFNPLSCVAASPTTT